MSYLCKICQKIFKYDYLLIRHMNKKITCDKKLFIKNNDLIKNINNEIELQIKLLDDKINDIYNKSLENLHLCNFCNKEFKLKGNLKRHMDNYCIEKKKILEEKNILLLEKKINENFMETNKKYFINNMNNPNDNINNDNTTNNINNINNINNNINNNDITNNTINVNFNINSDDLKLNSFGKEDISHITKDEYKKILSTFFTGFIEYIKKIHFDDRMPANHNVYMSKVDSKYAYIYDDNQWNIQKKEEIIDKIISKKKILLNNMSSELLEKGQITDNIYELHAEFNMNYIQGGTECEKSLSKDVELLLYNYRNKVLDKNNNSNSNIKTLK